MMTLCEIKRMLRAGPYAWPGGYEIIFWSGSCEPLCFKCVKKNYREVVEDTKAAAESPGYSPDWALEATEVNWEDQFMHCAECNIHMRPEYGGD